MKKTLNAQNERINWISLMTADVAGELRLVVNFNVRIAGHPRQESEVESYGPSAEECMQAFVEFARLNALKADQHARWVSEMRKTGLAYVFDEPSEKKDE